MKAHPPRISPSMKVIVGILNFQLRPATIIGVAPVQALTNVERAVIDTIHQCNKDDLKKIVRELADGKPVDDTFTIVTFPNPPHPELLTQIHNEVFHSGVTHILIYGLYHEVFAWLAASEPTFEFFMVSMHLLSAFIPRTDPMELNLVARMAINAFLRDSSLTLTDEVYTSIINFIKASRHIGIDFTKVFRRFAQRVLSDLPRMQKGFLEICAVFISEARPFVQLSGDDSFASVLGDLINALNLGAINLLCLAGSLQLPIFPEMITQFEAIPGGVLRLLTGKPPTSFFRDSEVLRRSLFCSRIWPAGGSDDQMYNVVVIEKIWAH
jgi:hypothetical protein